MLSQASPSSLEDDNQGLCHSNITLYLFMLILVREVLEKYFIEKENLRYYKKTFLRPCDSIRDLRQSQRRRQHRNWDLNYICGF